MKRILVLAVVGLLAVSAQANDNDTKADIEAYWNALSKTVREGDAAGYRALYHDDAVVVMVESSQSHTIDSMMEKWKPGFDATAAGKMKANVEDRLNKQVFGEDSAWIAGIFHYWTIAESGERTDHYAWFESVLVKKDGKWLQTMELQRKTATLDEWKSLAKK